ncbi:FG-GAP-like repeat-containing protein [Glaciecola sp. KUL10]|uniref:FG-GAP-like repeat-containing protein n=1 Tax=Glaciecola sp. (strain KUL10) TaxID=2161813 RepID=UPI000D785DD0|nr:FG-GAP-like repeat-containing protein [Glaciecola sp. KUL10]GBL03801.1 metallophosphoesterase [Glaciecola sp. KUL10]
MHFFKSFVIFIAFILFASFAHSQHYAEKLSIEVPANSFYELYDVSQSGNLLLFASNYLDENGSVTSSPNNIYFYIQDIAQDTVVRVSLANIGAYFSAFNTKPFFYNNDKNVIFYAQDSNIADSVFSYDIESGEVTNIEFTSNRQSEYPLSLKTDATDSILVIGLGYDIYKKESPNAEFEKLALEGEQNIKVVLGVGSDQSILIGENCWEDSCSVFNYFSTGSGLISLKDNTNRYQRYSAALSHDGSLFARWNSDKSTITIKHSEDQFESEKTIGLKGAFSSDGQFESLTISSDNRYIGFGAQLTRTLDQLKAGVRQSLGVFVVDITTEQTALVGLHDNFDVFDYSLSGISAMHFATTENTLYWSRSNANRGTYRAEIATSVFDIPNTPLQAAITSNAPFSATINFASQQNTVIERKSQHYDETPLNMLSFETLLVDSSTGLQSGDTFYKISKCNENWACNHNAVTSLSVEVLDFENKITVEKLFSEGTNNTTLLTLSAELDNAADSYKVHSLSSNQHFYSQIISEGNTFSNEVGFRGFVAKITQCLSSSLRNQPSCSKESELLTLAPPILQENGRFDAKFLPDFSGIRIRWDNIKDHQYKLSRNGVLLQTDEQQNTYIDTELDFGATYQYELEQCLDKLCHTQRINFKLDRPRNYENLSVDSRDAENTLFITYSANLAYDSFKLYRSVGNEKEQLLATLMDEREVYIDDTVIAPRSYRYRLETCFKNICDKLGGDLSRSSTPNSPFINGERLLAPNNLTVSTDQYFGRLVLGWDKVPNATHYRIIYNFSNNYSTHKEVDASVNAIVLDDYEGPYADISIRSENAAVSRYQRLDSLATTIKKVNLLPQFKNERLQPPQELTINYRVSNSDEPAKAIVNWSDYTFADFFELVKLSDNGFDVIEQGAGRYFREFLVSSTEANQGSGDYAIRACSTFTNTCSEISDSVTVDFDSLVPLPEELPAPIVTFNTETAEFDISINLPTNPIVRLISMYMVDQNGYRRFVSSKAQNDGFAYAPNNSEQADTFQFQYQIRTTDYQTTEFSELSTAVSIPDDFLTIPNVPTLSSRRVFEEENELKAKIGIRFSLNAIKPVEYFEVFRAIDNNEYTSVGSFTLESGDSYGEFIESIASGKLITYQFTACNSAGCSGVSQNVNVYADTPLEEPTEPPSIPTNFKVVQNNELRSVTLSALAPTSANDLVVTYGRDQQSLNTQRIIRIAGDFEEVRTIEINNLEPGKEYFFRMQACNSYSCSEHTPTLSLITSTHLASSISLSGKDIRQVSRNSRQTMSFTSKNISVGASNGSLDTFTGTLYLERFFQIGEGAFFSTSIFPKLSTPSACSTLFKNTMPVIRQRYSQLSYNEEYEQDLFELIYTGNGCEEHPELEPFSLFIVSPFLNEALHLTDQESWLEQWLELRIDFDEKGVFTLSKNEEIIATADYPLDLQLFKLTRLAWHAENESPIRSLFIVSNNDETMNLNDFYVSEIRISRPSPRFARLFMFGHDAKANTEVKIYEHGGINSEQVLSFEIEDHENNLQGFIEDLGINKDLTLFMQRCKGELCGPITEATFIASNNPFREITYWPSPGVYMHSQAGRISVELDPDYRPVDNLKVFLHSEDGNETQVLYDDSLLNTLKQDNENYSRVSLEFDGITTNKAYNVSLEVCNPIGCFTTEESNLILLPPDSDGDGIHDGADAFPDDPTETHDTDYDGIGNNADEDDDNDGISDAAELAAGLNPNYAFDARGDLDRDGFSNIAEYVTGSSITDPEVTPDTEGSFISFESDNEKVEIIGDYSLYQRYSSFYHGYSLIYVDPVDATKELTVRKTGYLRDGWVSFAYRYDRYSRALFDLSIHINGERLENVERFVAGDFYYYRAPVSAGPATVEYKFTIDSESAPILLDGFFTPFIKRNTLGDRNGDNKAELIVRDPINFMSFTKDIETQKIEKIRFGLNTNDIPLAGDFDGDGLTDVAVRRPSIGTWFARNSSGLNINSVKGDRIQRVYFGVRATDIPTPGDFDGDGITDFAVRRSSDSTWYILNSSGTNYNSYRGDKIQRIRFGLSKDDIPVQGDYDGDGITDIAIRRPSSHTWYVLNSSGTNFNSQRGDKIQRVRFGLRADDIPVPADYDGDGITDFAVRRVADRSWYILQSSDGEIRRVRFGLSETDIPVVADYDGDGKADIAVRRPSSTMWFILKSSTGEIIREKFGLKSHYIPVLAPIGMRMKMAEGSYDFGSAVTNSIDDGLEDLINEQASYLDDMDFNRSELEEVSTEIDALE